MLKSKVLMFSAVLATVVASFASADMIHFHADLDGLQETPPNASPANGLADALIDIATNQVCVHLEFQGLTAAQTGAHIHAPAPAGQPAGVIMPLNLGSPSDTCAILSAQNISDIQNGLSY